MKNISVLAFSALFILPALLFPLFANGAAAHENRVTFKDVEGKEWILSEIKGPGKSVILDREKLISENFGGVYTIIFREGDNPNAGQVNGMGAPNRFFGPYTLGNNWALSLGHLASTMMMAFREPDGLSESEYFAFLSRVTGWYLSLREGKLELYSSNSDGVEATLVFTVN